MRQSTPASSGSGTIAPPSAPPVLATAASEGDPPALWALPSRPPSKPALVPPLLDAPPELCAPPLLDAPPELRAPPELDLPPVLAAPPVLDAPPLPELYAPPVALEASAPSRLGVWTLGDSHAGVAAHRRPASAAEASARLGEAAAGATAAVKASSAGLGMKP
jgi:hypothetical protein